MNVVRQLANGVLGRSGDQLREELLLGLHLLQVLLDVRPLVLGGQADGLPVPVLAAVKDEVLKGDLGQEDAVVVGEHLPALLTGYRAV